MSAGTVWILSTGLTDDPWYFTNEADAVVAYEAAIKSRASSDWVRHEYLDANDRTFRQCTPCSWHGPYVSLRGHAANVPWEAQ